MRRRLSFHAAANGDDVGQPLKINLRGFAIKKRNGGWALFRGKEYVVGEVTSRAEIS